MAEGMLSLSWNNHSSTFCHMLSTLREMERYTDVTVACDGKFYPAHKLVLSTCSDYFLKMFERTPCKHPIIVVKDVECRDIEALLSYMYAGVVSVAQNDLAQLIKAAELLQIKGLAVPDEPPSSTKKAGHIRSSSDDRSSPHAKRQRRDQNTSSSPRSSPFRRGSEHSQEHMDTNTRHNNGDQKEDQRLERRGEKLRTDQQPEQQVGQGMEQRMEHLPVTMESSEAQDEVDESLVKEEIVDPESESDVPDAGFDYGSLVSDIGAEGDGETKDHPNLPLSSTYHQTSEDQAFNSQAGPSGLQGWSTLSEGGETSSQGYCGDLNQLSLPGPQPEQAHHLVGPDSDCQWMGWDRVHGPAVSLTMESMKKEQCRKIHRCPFCTYSTVFLNNMRKHVRTHTGEKPYMCSLCPFRSNQKSSLKRHVINIHNEGGAVQEGLQDLQL